MEGILNQWDLTVGGAILLEMKANWAAKYCNVFECLSITLLYYQVRMFVFFLNDLNGVSCVCLQSSEPETVSRRAGAEEHPQTYVSQTPVWVWWGKRDVVSECVWFCVQRGTSWRSWRRSASWRNSSPGRWEQIFPKPELFWLFMDSVPIATNYSGSRRTLDWSYATSSGVCFSVCVCLVESETHRRGAQRGQDSHPLQRLRGSGRSSGLRPARGQTLDQTHCCR